MASKPKNIPKLGGYIYPDITPEENEAAIKRIQDVLVLIGIHYLKSKREKKG